MRAPKSLSPIAPCTGRQRARAPWLLACAAALCAFAPAAMAQGWPARPVRLVVPFPAGGGTDMIARDVANKMTAQGYNFVIENKPGSGGNLGVDAAAKAAPDGYTFVLGQSSNLAINATLYPKLPYDPRQLTPVGLVASAPMALVVAADSPYKTLADLVAAARARPDALNYATSGNGTVAHLAMESFQKAAGVRLVHVPYKGAAQGVTDVISGQVQVYVSSIPTLIGHIKNGKMRALAVTSAKRTDDLPQVPTVAESGYAGFDAVTWFGVVGPRGVPADIVAKFNADLNRALQTPELRKRLGDQGADVMGGTPEAFGQLIRDDIVRWGALVKSSGAQAN